MEQVAEKEVAASKTEKAPEWSPVTQMTLKGIGCLPKEAIKQEKTVFMARLYGEAAAIKTKEAKNGDVYSYFIGEFRAENGVGKRFESCKLFLPGSIFEEIEAALKAAGDKAVVFAYDIFASPSDNTIGYQYAAKKVMKAATSDRLSQLQSQVDQKAIPKA